MPRMLAWTLLAFVSCAQALASEFQDDLRERRRSAMERLGPEAMLILWSAPLQTYSRDVEYEYRQNSNLYYLTGIEQDDTVLVLMPGNQKRKEILFIKPTDPMREHWVGHFLTTEEATAQTGIETVYMRSEFDRFVTSILAYRFPYGQTGPRRSPEYNTFFEALSAGRARVALVLEPKPGLSGPLAPVFEFANRLRERFTGFSIQDASDLFRDQRQVKTPYERKVLERSVEISNEAHLAALRAVRPGVYEYEVKAAIEQVYKVHGAWGWGYPPIVGSGPNAMVLHYAESGRKMEAGDLILIDAAGNYQYMTGDITRTWPVSGAFSRAQKDIYSVVLAAQEEAMKTARPGARAADVEEKVAEIIKHGLLKLGLIMDASGDQYRTWYTHGSVHFIGMDVHDVGDYERPLQAGMAFVIEPGIYVREGALENLPKTKAYEGFAEKVRPVYDKYKNIGVRIEDSFLLTESGLKQLSAKVPRTIEEIENFMQARKRE